MRRGSPLRRPIVVMSRVWPWARAWAMVGVIRVPWRAGWGPRGLCRCVINDITGRKQRSTAGAEGLDELIDGHGLVDHAEWAEVVDRGLPARAIDGGVGRGAATGR